jgi:hypothetical protein
MKRGKDAKMIYQCQILHIGILQALFVKKISHSPTQEKNER